MAPVLVSVVRELGVEGGAASGQQAKGGRLPRKPPHVGMGLLASFCTRPWPSKTPAITMTTPTGPADYLLYGNRGVADPRPRAGGLRAPPRVINCVMAQSKRFSDGEVQDFYLDDPRPIQTIIIGCAQKVHSRPLS